MFKEIRFVFALLALCSASPLSASEPVLAASHAQYVLLVGLALLLPVLLTLLWFQRRQLLRVIEAQRLSELRERTRTEVLELLAQGAPLDCILEGIVVGVERNRPGVLCSVLLFDADSGQLRLGAAPSLPAFYNHAIDGITVGAGQGSCGSAAHSGQRVVAEDVMTHPAWESYRGLAAQAGLRSCWSEPIWSSTGKLLGTFAIYHPHPNAPDSADIELIEEMSRIAEIAIERTQHLQALRDSEQHYRLLADNVSDVIWTMTPTGRFTYISPSLERLCGYTVAEAMSRRFSEMLTQESAAVASSAFSQLHEALASGQELPVFHRELEQRCKDGRTVWTEVATSGMFDSQGQLIGIIGISRDISERKRAEQRLAHLARYDQLTELPNRTLFSDRISQALSSARREATVFAVMFIDLDRFKPINDQHGHELGDRLLRSAARRMLESVRDSDTVARVGGDEFVVLLRNVQDASNALMVANKIRRELGREFLVDGLSLQISSSIGIAMYPQHGESETVLTRNADAAMYQAKRAGRDRVTLFRCEWESPSPAAADA